MEFISYLISKLLNLNVRSKVQISNDSTYSAAGVVVGKLLYSSHEIALNPILYAPIERVMHKNYSIWMCTAIELILSALIRIYHF